MRPHLHYDPSKVATYMADKTCVRTVLALAAAQDLILGHMDITGAYLHEKYAHTTPVYVWQPKRFDGSYKHRQPADRLVGNIYGTLPGANIYMTKLYAHLTTGRYQQLTSDPSLFIKRHEHAYILNAVSIDEFLVASNVEELIDKLCQHLQQNIQSRGLGNPQATLIGT